MVRFWHVRKHKGACEILYILRTCLRERIQRKFVAYIISKLFCNYVQPIPNPNIKTHSNPEIAFHYRYYILRPLIPVRDFFSVLLKTLISKAEYKPITA